MCSLLEVQFALKQVRTVLPTGRNAVLPLGKEQSSGHGLPGAPRPRGSLRASPQCAAGRIAETGPCPPPPVPAAARQNPPAWQSKRPQALVPFDSHHNPREHWCLLTHTTGSSGAFWLTPQPQLHCWAATYRCLVTGCAATDSFCFLSFLYIVCQMAGHPRARLYAGSRSSCNLPAHVALGGIGP